MRGRDAEGANGVSVLRKQNGGECRNLQQPFLRNFFTRFQPWIFLCVKKCPKEKEKYKNSKKFNLAIYE